MNVKDVLTRKPDGAVETIGGQETMGALAARLAEKNIGALLVVGGDDGLIGVISERDMVRALAADGVGCLSQPVAKFMTSKVITATPGDDTVDVLDRMTKGRFRHMPVIADDAVVGVVSIGDVVKARIDVLQRENAALEEFIRS